MLRISLKFGVLMGFAFCAYTTLMWLTSLDTTYLSIGHYLDIAILLLPITIIVLAIRSAMLVDRVSIFRRIQIGLLVSLVSFAIYAPFLFVYHNYINPTWFDAVLALKESQMAATQVDPAVIQAELQKLREMNQAQSGILSGFLPSVIILPMLIVLVTWPFVRNPKAIHKDSEIE